MSHSCSRHEQYFSDEGTFIPSHHLSNHLSNGRQDILSPNYNVPPSFFSASGTLNYLQYDIRLHRGQCAGASHGLGDALEVLRELLCSQILTV